MTKLVLPMMAILIFIASCSTHKPLWDHGVPTSETSERQFDKKVEQNTGVRIEVLEEDDERSLIAHIESEENIKRVMTELTIAGAYSSTLYVKPYTIETIGRILKVKQIRKIKKDKYSYFDSYYGIHDNERGGRAYIFYYLAPEGYISDFPIFSIQKLRFSNFLKIREGISTYADVLRIDPAASFNFSEAEDETERVTAQDIYPDWLKPSYPDWDLYFEYMATKEHTSIESTAQDIYGKWFRPNHPSWNAYFWHMTKREHASIKATTQEAYTLYFKPSYPDWDAYSGHMTTRGYISIGYKKRGDDFVVASIEEMYDDRIAAINPLDWL
jgi:hypothetical protein